MRASSLRGIDFQGLAILAGVVVVGVVVWRASKAAGKVAQDVAPYVNPADSRNVVYGGISGVGAAVTGDDSWSLGGQLADWFSPAVRRADDMNASAPLAKGTMTPAMRDAAVTPGSMGSDSYYPW